MAVLAFWCGLGPGVLKWRVLATALLAFLVSGSFVVGMLLPEWPNSSMPVFVCVYLFGLGLGGFVIAASIFAAIFWLTREYLAFGREKKWREPADASYSIAYLIGLTSAVAVAIALVRAILPAMESMANPPAGEVARVTLVVSQHTLVSTFLVASCAMLILRRDHNWHGVAALAIVLGLAAPASLYCISLYTPRAVDSEMILFYVCYLTGLCLAALAAFYLLRKSDYRLVKGLADNG